MTTRLRCAIDSATTLLAAAGIDSARNDAEELAAYLAGTERDGSRSSARRMRRISTATTPR